MISPRRPTGATLAARPHLLATLLLGLFVLAFLWPALVGGQILSPIADLYGVIPWQHSAPSDVQSYSNPVLADLPFVDYPWRFLARALIHEGTFPAWNPYALGGIPFYSNPQTGLFSLFNLPLWILPLTYGLGVSAALKLLAGALGTYLLVRQLRLGFLPGLLAGIAFAFSALNIVWLSHETLPGVAVMLPWAVLFVERIFERGRAGSAIALAAVIAIGLGGGHPGMQVHLIVVTGVYALVRAAATRAWHPRELALIGGGLAIGVLLMAFMLIPESRSTHDTVGVLARRAGELPGDHMPLAALKTVLFPDWWGRLTGIEGIGDPATNPVAAISFNERTFYGGVVALLLACVGLLVRGEWRRKAPFALLAVLGLAIPLDAPGLHWLVTHLPVLSSVQAQRLYFAFDFSIAVLAAFGLQALLDAPRGERWRRVAVPLAAVAVALIAWTTAGAAPGDAGHVVTHFLHGTDYPSRSVLAQTSIVWFLLFALGVGVALLLARLQPGWRVAIAVAIVLLAAGDAYHFAHGYNPMGPESKVIPPVTPAIAYLQRHRDEGRIVGLNSALPNDWALVYGIRDVRGYDPPQPTTRMLALWRRANPTQRAWQSFVLEELSPAAVQVLSALGARYVVADVGATVSSTPQGKLRVVYAGPDATIIANAGAAPRALVPARTRVTSGERATRDTLVEAGFDARTTAAIERDQPGAAALADTRAPLRGSVVVARERNASVTLRARLDRRGLVVLNEDFTEGWTVRVDGHAADALHVNDVMRGVIVPAGRHEIVWSYAVPGLRLGALLSLLTFVALAAGAVALAVRRRAPALARSAASRGS